MHRNQSRTAPRRLSLELLEDRCVPAADWLTGVGAIGDSLTNEYLGIASRNTAQSWVELLAGVGGVNFGAFNANWGSPRGAGYEYNWGLGAANTEEVLANGLHTQLADQVASGQVSLAVVQGAHTDLIHKGSQSLVRYNAIYNGTLTGAALTELIDSVVANIATTVDTLLGAGNVRVILFNTADLNCTPLFYRDLGYNDPVGLERFHNAVVQLNSGIEELAAQRGLPVVDLFTYGQQIRQGDQWVVGGVELNMTAYVANQSNPTHLFEDSSHPGTIGQGLLTNAVIAAANQVYGADLTPLSDQEILFAAGVTPPASGPTYFDISSFVIYPPSHAGVLDQTFGEGGKVVTDILGGSSEEWGRSVAVQSDGKILVAGGQYYGSLGTSDFLLIRYNTDGSLDTTFGNGGRVTTDFGTPAWYDLTEQATAIALQSDGKILVAGNAGYELDGSLWRNLVVARYTSAGVLDATFGDGGKLIVNFNTILDPSAAIVLQPDGKIVVGGGRLSGGIGFVALARYTPSGAPDNTFDGDGRVFRPAGSVYNINSLALQADGKIVVGGERGIARFTNTGALDTTFDGDGWATISDISISSLILQNDKIVVAGSSSLSGGVDFALARYTSTGVRDTTFGGGLVTTDFGGYDGATGMTVQPDGNIVVVGTSYSYQGTSRDFALARYTADGNLDATFSDDGKLLTAFGSYDEASAVTVLPDGRIVAVGTSAGDIALATYTSTGALDPDFGSGGKVLTDFLAPTFNGRMAAVVTQPDGKLVVVGSADDNFALLRYTPGGRLDTTFGNNGVVIKDFGLFGMQPTSVAIQADGNILVAGWVYQDESYDDFALARFTSDGTLDTTFGTDGLVLTDFGDLDYAYAVAVQADGKILVSGSIYSLVTDSYDFAVARYTSNGSLDTTFGTAGVVTIDFNSGRDLFYAPGMVVQPDGKIVLAGYSDQGATGYDFVVARLNGDGSLDATFDTNGKLILDLGTRDDGAGGVALQADGKIVLAGWLWNDAGYYEMAVVRLNGDGSLDTAFDTDGWRAIDFGPGDTWANAVAIQADGKIILTGPATPGSTGFDFALARLNGDGSLDTTFGIGGKATTNFGPGNDEPFGLALQPNGTIVVVGITQRSNGDTDFALARYHGAVNTDNDGVPDHIEDGAPNNGDGNNDGDPDSEQAYVTSVPNAVDSQYVTLQSPDFTTLVSVTALPAPSPAQAPADAQFPVGAFSFSVTGVAAGGTVDVILFMPAGVVVNAYYKFNPATETWELFPGAVFEDRNGDGTLDVVLTLTDGGAGDADGVVNGIIVDPGAPAYLAPSVLLVQIDIRPQSLNLISQGVLPVVLFGSAALDVTRVDLASIAFAGAGVYLWSLADVDGDGHLDLVLHFRTQDTNLRAIYEQLLVDDHDEDGILDSTQQEATVSLTGQTVDDLAFEGFDSLNLFLSGRALRDLLAHLFG